MLDGFFFMTDVLLLFGRKYTGVMSSKLVITCVSQFLHLLHLLSIIMSHTADQNVITLLNLICIIRKTISIIIS